MHFAILKTVDDEQSGPDHTGLFSLQQQQSGAGEIGQIRRSPPMPGVRWQANR